MTLKRIAVLLVLALVGITASAQELTETYTTSDGSLTFSHPAGFQVQEFTNGAAGVLDANETFAVFMFNGLVMGDLDLTGTIDPIELFTALGLIGEEVGEPEQITLANGSGTLTSVVIEEIGSGLVAIIETESGPLIGLLAAESGEITPENRELGLAILGSVVISEPTVVRADITKPAVDECAIPVEEMPEGVVQFCGGVEVSLPEGWSLGVGYETIDTFAGIQTADFSVSASINVFDISEYYNPDIYFADVASFSAEAAGHEEYDPAEHVVTLVDEDALTIQVYDPTQYVELEEGAVAQEVGVVTLNRDLFVTVTVTWVPSSVQEDVRPVVDQLLQSVRLNDTYTGTPAYVIVDGEPVFIYDAGWTDSTYLFAFSDQDTYIVNCPAAGADLNGTVWGTDIYTDDSAVCVAAVHAGAITTDGGMIRVTMLEGQESYTGSERNGVTSQDYGSWGGSFSVEPFTMPE